MPEQAGALFMHQNPSGQKDGDCAKDDTIQGRKQLTDTVLTAQGKHRAISASSSDLLVVRLFVVTEELKKGLGWANEALGWFYRWRLQRARVSVGEGCLHRTRWPTAQRGKGREARIGHFCRIRTSGLEKRSLHQHPKWIWTEQGCWRKGVALVVSHTHDGACLCLTQERHLHSGDLCRPRAKHRGEGAEVILLWVACDTVETDALHACRNSSLTYSRERWQSESCYWGWQNFTCWQLPIWFLRWLPGATLAPSLPPENPAAATFFFSLPIPQSFSQHPAIAPQREDYEFKCREKKNSSSRSGWTFWRRKMLFFMQMLLVTKSEGKGKTEHTSRRGKIVSK